MALITFDLVGLEFPRINKSNFFDTEPKTFPPSFSTIDFASDLLIFSKPPVKSIVLSFKTPFFLELVKF